MEEPTKPMAPMPMELPSSISSNSSAAILGSGLRSPTTRRQAACLPSVMQTSLEPPRPMPTMAGWQARPRLPKATRVSRKKRLTPAMPSPGKSMR